MADHNCPREKIWCFVLNLKTYCHLSVLPEFSLGWKYNVLLVRQRYKSSSWGLLTVYRLLLTVSKTYAHALYEQYKSELILTSNPWQMQLWDIWHLRISLGAVTFHVSWLHKLYLYRTEFIWKLCLGSIWLAEFLYGVSCNLNFLALIF